MINIQGLKPRTVPSKVPFIQDLLTENNQLFIALSETWLAEHRDAELNIAGYSLFRCDRQRSHKKHFGRDGGGVAIYLRSDLAITAEEIVNMSVGVVEGLAIRIKAHNLVLAVIYRQPHSAAAHSTHIEFNKIVKALSEGLKGLPAPDPTIILCGDMNLPHISWPRCSFVTGGSSEERMMVEELQLFSDELYLKQIITESTHRKGNTLDLVFTNDHELVHSYLCSSTIFSDHYIIECFTTLCTNVEGKAKQSRVEDDLSGKFSHLNFLHNTVDWNLIMSNLAQIDWKKEFRYMEVDEMVCKFINICSNVANKLVPVKSRHSKGSQSIIPRERKNLMRRRNRINKRLLGPCTRNESNKLLKELRSIEITLKSSYELEYESQEQKAVEAITVNPKYFYSYAKKFSKTRSRVGPLVNQGGTIISDSVEMAEILADQYMSVFSIPLLVANSISAENRTLSFTSCPFDKEDIELAIDELSMTAAAGPDEFPAVLLKKCKHILSEPLCRIWKHSLKHGIVPPILKMASIVPIHKGGSKGTPKNYRPIALTSHLIKIFEKVLRKYIVSYLEENELLNNSQHGFRSGRSCLSQLIAHMDNILEGLERGDNVDVIYLDFAKAFDKVDIAVTLNKLQSLGISGGVLKWMKSFLVERKQYVTVDGNRSSLCDVRSGVPQGSVLGPLLFLVLIGDIDSNVSGSFVSSFADDTRIGRSIKTESDVISLQADLDSIYWWVVENNMQLNSDKFECMRYGKNKDIARDTEYYSDCGSVIMVKENVKDLGITLSNDASYAKHIEGVIQNGKSISGWVFRVFKTRQLLPMISLYKSMVRSKLEYCSQLWCPTKKGQIQSLEMVQRNFLRKIVCIRHLSYWEQLKKLNLYSLERRRERYTIIYVWKILEGLVPNLDDSSERRLETHTHSRRGRLCKVPSLTSGAPSSVQSLIDGSFAVRGPRLFNALPTEVRNTASKSVEGFKNILDRFLKSVPDEPHIQGYTAQRRAESNSILLMTQFCVEVCEVPPTVRRPTMAT